jgi:hypothetical protein
VRNGKRALLKALLIAGRLDRWAPENPRDPAEAEVKAMLDDLLASPVLRKVLCNPTNFSLKNDGKVFARINRAEFGEFDSLVLGLFLMAHYKGQVVVPDFGFYGREAHIALIREKRLIAGR